MHRFAKTTAAAAMAAVSPKLLQLSADVLFADVWERPNLSKRDRSLITVAVLMALYRTDQLPHQMERALENGVTQDELGELITHTVFYAGWPTGGTACRIAEQVFAARNAS